MKREMIRAIKHLPEAYEADGTEFAEYGGFIFAVNGKAGLPIIRYLPNSKTWEELLLEHQN